MPVATNFSGYIHHGTASTMSCHALCYLITSFAGDLVAQHGAALWANPLDVTGVCRLLAYHTAAMGGQHICVLDLNNMSLVVRTFEGFIAAAIIPPDSQAAEAQFDVHLLAVLFQLGTLQSDSLHFRSANEELQHSGSISSTAVQVDLQRFISYRESAMKGLSMILQIPGMCCAELVAVDVHDKCFRVHSFPTDYFVNSDFHAYNTLQLAIHAACKGLHNVALPDCLSTSASAATHCQQKNTKHRTAELKATFAAICLDIGGQQGMHRIAAVKCLRILDLHMFILAWSDVHLLHLSAQQGLAATPHVRIGKAAVQPDLRFRLNTAATFIKKGLYVHT